LAKGRSDWAVCFSLTLFTAGFTLLMRAGETLCQARFV
jgi:hypothetical protein